LWCVFFCGGDCAEDINENLKDILETVPDLKVPNADTILLVLKSLKTEKELEYSSTGNAFHINIHESLNRLNLSILTKLKILNKNQLYDYDFDNEVLGTEKWDAKRSYKQKDGYFPGMSTINGIPVYFENRDGNMNVKTGQASLLIRSFNLLREFGVRIHRARMDCGSYTKEVIEAVKANSLFFYIRAMRCGSLEDLIRDVDNWEKTEINHKIYEVASVKYKPFGGEDEYRVVITREPNKSGQMDLFTNDAMIYRGILTDDFKTNDKDIVQFYNQRGGEERVIDVMNNDFGWKQMPFSFMNENSVFLIVQMICKNVYSYIISKFSLRFKHLKKNYRLKKFIFRFITVPAKWITRGRGKVLKLFTQKPYEALVM
jgi:hypothetical protein